LRDDLTGAGLLLEIPAEFQAIKMASMDLARLTPPDGRSL
jgi:hypothetical protein